MLQNCCNHFTPLYFAASLHSTSNSSMSLVRKLVSFRVQKKAGLRLAFFCTQNRGRINLFLVRHSERGGLRPLSLAYSLRPNTFSRGLGVDGTDGQLPVAVAVARIYIAHKIKPKTGRTAIGSGIERTGPVSHIA